MEENKKPQNPNAFPLALTNESNYASDGMTLRDYFANSAMQSICAGTGAKMVAEIDKNYNGNNWAEIVASNAYDFADAMLKQRELK